MRRAWVIVAAAAAVIVCGGSASAARSSTQEVTIKVSDGTNLACGLILPSGSPPVGGWPGIILFHGLGQSHTNMESIGRVLTPLGFASLACDARGTGASGGTFGLDGPKEVQDARDLFTWFAARSEVSDTRIGAFGLSLGGAAVWNAAVAGVPFKAIVPAITWTNLATALNPKGVPKSGEVAQLGLSVPFSRWDPSLAEARKDLLAGKVTAAVKSMEVARSSRAQLHGLTVPTLILQGRHDFFFDMNQALNAYKLLSGPKRLYLGDLGHSPATNPTIEVPRYVGEAVAWFEHYLAGVGTVRRGVELAHDPWDGATTSYSAPPQTRRMTVNLPGSKSISAAGSVRRLVRFTGGPLETFGNSFVSVRYSGNSTLTSIRAMVSVKDLGQSPPTITVGAAKIANGSGVVKIPLVNEALLVPRGMKLVVTVGATTAGGVYLPNHGGPGNPPAIKIRRITLNLSLLRKPVSG